MAKTQLGKKLTKVIEEAEKLGQVGKAVVEAARELGQEIEQLKKKPSEED